MCWVEMWLLTAVQDLPLVSLGSPAAKPQDNLWEWSGSGSEVPSMVLGKEHKLLPHMAQCPHKGRLQSRCPPWAPSWQHWWQPPCLGKRAVPPEWAPMGPTPDLWAWGAAGLFSSFRVQIYIKWEQPLDMQLGHQLADQTQRDAVVFTYGKTEPNTCKL